MAKRVILFGLVVVFVLLGIGSVANATPTRPCPQCSPAPARTPTPTPTPPQLPGPDAKFIRDFLPLETTDCSGRPVRVYVEQWSDGTWIGFLEVDVEGVTVGIGGPLIVGRNVIELPDFCPEKLEIIIERKGRGHQWYVRARFLNDGDQT